LGILFLLSLVFNPGSAGGNIVNADIAADGVVGFINSNPSLDGSVELVSSKREGQLYKVTLQYQGQEIPLYTTLDGEYLVGDIIPLSSVIPIDPANTGNGVSDVSEDDDPFLGDENAPVTIIEFSDYQCPFCQSFWIDTLPEIKEKYIDTGKVKLVYRDYPLGIHPEAQIAAEAAECVRDAAGGSNEVYFEYHDVLFANQGDLNEENLISWASDLGYDITSCLENGDFTEEVQQDFFDGQVAGVTGTPSFFINGKKVSGALPFEVFEQMIEAELGQ